MPDLFTPIIGNETIKEYMRTLLKKQAIGNTLLLSGPAGIGKGLFARAFAQILLGKVQELDPDIHTFIPEGKSGIHSISSVRNLLEKVYLAPFASKKKVFILHDADCMHIEGANALLKTIEEPPEDTFFILLTSNYKQMIPTLLSRCRIVRFQTISENDIVTFLEKKYAAPHEKALKAASLAHGSIGKAIQNLQESTDKCREICLDLLSCAPLKSYTEFLKIIKELVEQIEKVTDTSFLPSSILPTPEQEEGRQALQIKQKTEALFEVILSWYRDLQYMQISFEKHLMLNKDYEIQLEKALERGDSKSISYIEKCIEKARLSLQRFNSLANTLETLFLALNVT